jgi:peroxiredoxin
MSVIEPGTRVPSFKLATEDGGSVTEKDLKGERTVLVFYPFAFSPVCTDQLQLYEAALDQLVAQGVTKLCGVSCDSSWSQKAFREQLGVSIEQLSDFEPKGAACKAFGVLHEGGFPERALVAIDGTNTPPTVRWSYQAPMPGELPSVKLLREGVSIAFGGAIPA